MIAVGESYPSVRGDVKRPAKQAWGATSGPALARLDDGPYTVSQTLANCFGSECFITAEEKQRVHCLKFVCVPHVCGSPRGLEEVTGFSGTGVIGSCELFNMRPNPCPLQDSK